MGGGNGPPGGRLEENFEILPKKRYQAGGNMLGGKFWTAASVGNQKSSEKKNYSRRPGGAFRPCCCPAGALLPGACLPTRFGIMLEYGRFGSLHN